MFSSLQNSKTLQDFLSHRIFKRMHEILNVAKQNNSLHNLSIICETNLLSLVNPWWDNNYQIQTKVVQCFTTSLLHIWTRAKYKYCVFFSFVRSCNRVRPLLTCADCTSTFVTTQHKVLREAHACGCDDVSTLTNSSA